MRKLITACTLGVVLAPAAASAYDLNPEEGLVLRERAQALLAERERKPEWDGGTRRLPEPHGEVDLRRSKSKVKMRSAKSKRPRESIAQKVKRGARNLPGALLRER